MKSTSSALLLFCSILFQSCYSPSPISKLKPLHQNTYWSFGNEVVQKSSNKIYLKKTFLKSDQNEYVFEIDIHNQSGDTILIDPSMFKYIPLDKDTFDIETYVFALSSEEEILRIDKKMAINEAEISKKQSLSLLRSTTNLIVDSKNIATGDELTEKSVKRREFEEQQEYTNQQSYLNKHSNLNRQREFWEISTLRKTSLPNGYHLKGLLLFPRNYQASYIKFYYPIDNKIITFDFQQEIISAK